MYYRPIIRKINNLLKHTDVGMFFKNTKTLQLTKPKIFITQKQDNSGSYNLTCSTSKMSYIGQTYPSLKQRYQEYTRYIKHNNPQSAYALYILKKQARIRAYQRQHDLNKTYQ
jgi:hypothetical protein